MILYENVGEDYDFVSWRSFIGLKYFDIYGFWRRFWFSEVWSFVGFTIKYTVYIWFDTNVEIISLPKITIN